MDFYWNIFRINFFSRRAIFLIIIFYSSGFFSSAFALTIKDPFYFLVLDKKTNTLELTEYKEDQYDIIKKWHATIGKVVGDKEEEGDLKTPEGIYFFTARLRPPSIKPKFGKMALYMDYPNFYDQMAGRTGHDIMLHATDEPERLEKNYDSEGCVVIQNEEILDLEKYVTLQMTPFIIYGDKSKESRMPASGQSINDFFQSWIDAWENKKIDEYSGHYHSSFQSGGMSWAQWKEYKNGLNKRYATIKVNPKEVHYFNHPKYSVILFQQNYESQRENGKKAFVSKGVKRLYVGKENGQFKIIAEEFHR